MKVITTLLLYLLTSQEKVYSDVIFTDKTEKITCNLPGGEEKPVLYYYTGDFFANANTSKTYSVPSNGGIFACVENATTSSVDVSCKSHKIFIIIPSTTRNDATMSESIIKRIGQNGSFPCLFNESGAYILLWIFKRQNVFKCIFSAMVTRKLEYIGTSLSQLCCSGDDVKNEGRIQLQNQTDLHKLQNFHLDLVNLTSSDSGEYLSIKYSWVNGTLKWKVINKYSLEVTGDENPVATPGTPFYIIAGPIGGFIAVLAIVLLSIFCIKHRGKQKKVNKSSPVGLPDEYESMPYAVSEQKEETLNAIYSLAQNPVPAMDSEYSEVQLTNLVLSDAHGFESDAKTNIVPDAEYAEIKM